MLVLTYNGWCYNEDLVYDSYFVSGRLRTRDILVTIKVPWAVAQQSLGRVQLFATPWTAAHQASLSFTISWSLLKLMSIESVMPSDQLMLCRPLLLLPLPFPSITIFSNESALRIRWPQYWSFSFSISPSNEYSRLISFRVDWFDLAVQGNPSKTKDFISEF